MFTSTVISSLRYHAYGGFIPDSNIHFSLVLMSMIGEAKNIRHYNNTKEKTCTWSAKNIKSLSLGYFRSHRNCNSQDLCPHFFQCFHFTNIHLRIDHQIKFLAKNMVLIFYPKIIKHVSVYLSSKEAFFRCTYSKLVYFNKNYHLICQCWSSDLTKKYHVWVTYGSLAPVVKTPCFCQLTY